MIQNGMTVAGRRSTTETQLIQGGVLTAQATFTSADARNAFDANGLLVVGGAGVNVPRTTYVPSGGVLIPVFWADGAVTNSLLQSRNLASGWLRENITTGKNQAGLDGVGNAAHLITDATAAVQGYASRSVTVSNDSNTHRSGHYIKKDADTTRFVALDLQLTGGTGVRQVSDLNTEDGSVIDYAAYSDGTVTVIDLGDWWFVLLTLANNSTGNTTLTYRIYPASSTVQGTGSAAAQGSCIYDFGGVYLNQTAPFHPFETGAAAITVAAENASVPLGSWFNATKGSIIESVWIPAFVGTQTIKELRLDDSNRIRLQVNASGNVVATVDDAAGTGGTITSAGALTAATLQKVALVYGSGGYRVHINGAKDGEDATLTVPAGLDTGNIGNANSGAHLYGGIADDLYLPNDISEAEANARTAL